MFAEKRTSDGTYHGNSGNGLVPQNEDQRAVNRNVTETLHDPGRQDRQETTSVKDIEPECIQQQITADADQDRSDDGIAEKHTCFFMVQKQAVEDARQGRGQGESGEIRS